MKLIINKPPLKFVFILMQIIVNKLILTKYKLLIIKPLIVLSEKVA